MNTDIYGDLWYNQCDMKELLYTLSDRFAMVNGEGKLAVIFIAALIVLFVIWNSGRGRVHPLLFVLSIWTGIAAAFVSLISVADESGEVSRNESGDGKLDEPKHHDPEKTKHSKKLVLTLLCVVFTLFAISLSGGRIWSERYLDSPKNLKTLEQDLTEVVRVITADYPEPGVLASEELLIRMQLLDGHVTPLYEIPKDGNPAGLSEEDSKLRDSFADIHPDFTLVHRLCKDRDSVYIVMHNEQQWPKSSPEEEGFTLMATVNHFEIYKYTGGAYE